MYLENTNQIAPEMKKLSFLFSLSIAFSSMFAFADQNVESASSTLTRSLNDPVPIIKSYARDSTKYSNDRKVVALFGDAKIESKNLTVVADEIIYDGTAQTLTIKSLHSLKYKDKEEKGSFAGQSLTLKLKGDKYRVI